MLSAASGQSLMAFQMSMHLDVPPPSNFFTKLIMMGHARFLPSDPDGLFVQWAPEACHWRNTEWDIEFVIDFLCPLEIIPNVTQKSGRSAYARRESKWAAAQARPENILHLFVEQGSHYDTNEILEKLRMLLHVYGLSVLTPPQDGRTVRELAAKSHQSFSVHMREAVTMAVEEEEQLLEQCRRALPAARGLAPTGCATCRESP